MTRLAPLAAIGLLAWAAPAQATSFKEISLSELVHSSVAVAQVKVLSTQSAWTPEPTNDMRTRAELQIVRSLDGDLGAGDLITVVEMGGTVEDYTVQAIGFPEFRTGDQLVVFLTHWPNAEREWRVAGYGQGIYEVVRDKKGKDALVPAPVQGHAPGTLELLRDTVVPKLMQVDDLASTIREIRR